MNVVVFVLVLYMMRYVVLILLIILLWFYYKKEDFTSRRDKAAQIVAWFNKTNKPTYTEYKQHFGSASNIVEYEDALLLRQRNKLDIDALLDKLS